MECTSGLLVILIANRQAGVRRNFNRQPMWTIASLQLNTFPSCKRQSVSATLGEGPESVPEESAAPCKPKQCWKDSRCMCARMTPTAFLTHDQMDLQRRQGAVSRQMKEVDLRVLALSQAQG